MTARHQNRRQFLRSAAALGSLALPAPAIAQAASARIVVIGGGFAGASCARTLRATNARLSVTLVEPNATYTALPLSNAVLPGLRTIEAQRFTYDRIAAGGVTVVRQSATGIDVAARTVTLADGAKLPYDRLVIAPGIELRFDALQGFSAAAAETMPHAWTNGEQILTLRNQLEAMDDGGVVVISAPVNPARCPPGPYERASMIAAYLKAKKPKSKVIVLDAKDNFTMKQQFQNAWSELYPGLVEWVGLSQGGNVTEVDVATKTLITDFDKVKADVANVIPPQRAGAVSRLAGVADRTGWCPVDPMTFESTLQPNIHVVGDAAIAGAMPRSAFAANEEAKICARAIHQLLNHGKVAEPNLASTCYSLIASDYSISIAGIYHPVNGQYTEVDGTGVTSPIDAPRSLRTQEANFADTWFKTITGEVFG